MMKIGIVADHAGFDQKQLFVKKLQEASYAVQDFGATEFNAEDDYLDIITR